MKELALVLETLTEHQEQSDLIRRILDNILTYPELAAVFAVPNGGFRHAKTGRQMLEEGVKPGVPDLLFPMARGGWFGYYQELKRTKDSAVSLKQKAWHRWLRAQGYLVEVCKGCEAGWNGFLDYLAFPPTPSIHAATPSEAQTLDLAHDLLPDWAAKEKRLLERRIERLKSGSGGS